MNPEELQQLRELIEFLKENKVGEFALERGELKVQLRFQQEPAPPAPASGAVPGMIDAAALGQILRGLQAPAGAATPLPSASAAADAAAAIRQHEQASLMIAARSMEAVAEDEAGLHMVKSPIVGTFYESPSPGAAAFVKVGDHIEAGQPLCIIEAMKLMNEIESDASGEVVKRLVTNGQAVEYGQPLFAVRTR